MDRKEYYGRGADNVANLPQDVRMEKFPDCDAYLNVRPGDTAKTIDSDIEYNHDYLENHLSKTKY